MMVLVTDDTTNHWRALKTILALQAARKQDSEIYMVIYSPVQLTGKQDIGILIREAFTLFGQYDFIRSACPPHPEWEFMPHVRIKWKQAAEHDQDSLSLTYGYTDAIASRRLHLFAFGSSRLVNFWLNELDFPLRISGCIWVIDSTRLLSSGRDDPILFDKLKNARLKNAGAITWTIKQKLAFIFVVTECNISQTSADAIRDIFALEPEIPVLLYAEGFNTENANLALSTLVERIVTLTT